LVARS